MHVVFGGAFNPPTKAHLDAVLHIRQRLDVGKVVFLPVGSAYGKPLDVSDTHRLKMLELLVETLADAEISTMEIDSKTYEGTYATLKRLENVYEGDLAFVIGADHLEKLPRWICAEALLEEFTIIVLNRGRVDLESILEKDAWLQRRRESLILLDDYDDDASSSAFRRSRDFSLLPDAVAAYVKCHDLYEE